MHKTTNFLFNVICVFLFLFVTVSAQVKNEETFKSVTITKEPATEQENKGGTKPACDFSKDDTYQLSSQFITLLMNVSSIKPEYPEEARKAKVSGRVIVRVLFDRQGRTAEVCFEEGDKLLRPPVLAVVEKWKQPKDKIRQELRRNKHKYLEILSGYTFK